MIIKKHRKSLDLITFLCHATQCQDDDSYSSSSSVELLDDEDSSLEDEDSSSTAGGDSHLPQHPAGSPGGTGPKFILRLPSRTTINGT